MRSVAKIFSLAVSRVVMVIAYVLSCNCVRSVTLQWD